MKRIKLVILLLITGVTLFASDVYEEIAGAIRAGDSHRLSTYFGSNIDLTIIDKENVYSRAQAELVIKDFFGKHIPKSFSIIHKGSSPEGTQYAIGNLVTTTGKSFRVSFYIKNNDGKSELKELRIESE